MLDVSNYMQSADKLNKSILYRGIILHEITLMENNLNSYLSNHFCGKNIDRTEDMLLLILGDERFTLNNKAQIFHFIGVNYDKAWYNSYKSTRPKQEKKSEYTMNQDLVDVIEHRNIFAHRTVIPDFDKYVNMPTMFVKYKNEVTPLFYMDEQVDDLVNQIRNLKNHFEKSMIFKLNKE